MKNQSGYIAVTSVIILILIFVSLTAALSAANYFSRFNILESEYKETSIFLAESCVDQAIFNLRRGVGFIGEVKVGKSSCQIRSVTPSGANQIVQTQGLFPPGPYASYTNLQVELTPSLSIISWLELPNF